MFFNQRMISISLLGSLLFLSACANPYRKNFTSTADAMPQWVVSRFAPSPASPRLRLSDDLREDNLALLESGYLLVGRSRFQGPQVDLDKAMAEGKRIGAAVVVVERKFVKTVTERVAYTAWTPERTTEIREDSRLTSGVHASRYESNVSIRQGGDPQTVYLPRDTDYYEQVATYWRKIDRPVLGAVVRNLNDDERRRLQTNSGLVVLAVMRGSPAFTADIFPGDIILSINDERAPIAEDFYEHLGTTWRATAIDLQLDREGTFFTRKVTLNP